MVISILSKAFNKRKDLKNMLDAKFMNLIPILLGSKTMAEIIGSSFEEVSQ